MGLERINEYKKKMGLTTEDLSRLSGVPIGTLNKILSGATKDPKLETLKSIARVLNLSLNDFDDLMAWKETEDFEQLASFTTRDPNNTYYDEVYRPLM